MIRISPSCFALVALISSLPFCLPAADSAWSLRPGVDRGTLVSPAGKDVLGYLKTKPAGSALSANSACGIYPLLTPAGESIVALAPKDHPHHRGVFFAWYEVNGVEKADFWGWGAHAPTKDVRVAVRPGAGTVDVVVADRGPGIPEAEQGRLFQAFSRGGREDTRTARGVGLGLALVRRYADAHRAKVVLDSAPGRGTTVTVRFPRNDGTAGR